MSAHAGEPLADLIARALSEDVGSGDVTSEATVPAAAIARARIVQKAPGVLFGLAAVEETMRQCGIGEIEVLIPDGSRLDDVPAEVLSATGPARGLLAAERTSLNLLAHLSGVATLTARYVEAVAGSGATILDTRKTTPGLRALEKQAVAAGGGRNHRMGLFDAILIKENHIALAGGLEEAVSAARRERPGLSVEVECRDIAEVAVSLAAGADRLLLDNMPPGKLREAVALRGAPGEGRPALEASGGVRLDTVAEIAASGVEFVSVGALTHSAPGLDFSLLIEPL